MTINSPLPHTLADSASPLPDVIPHTLAEDAHALCMACSFIVFGMACLKAAGLITGGIAGIALGLSYVMPISLQVLFFALNIPFLIFAKLTFGWSFVFKTILVNVLIVVMLSAFSRVLTFTDVNPYFAAIFGGTIIGMGMLALARHKASVGGIGVLALYFQEKRGWRAGHVLLAGDIVIFSAAISFLAPDKLVLSFLSAASLSLVMMIYHRPGRYVAA